MVLTGRIGWFLWGMGIDKKQAYYQKNMLGVMYYKGEGVRQNTAAAKEWFGKACVNGKQDSCDRYRKLNQKHKYSSELPKINRSHSVL